MGEGKRAREGRNVKGKARIGKGNTHTHTHPFNSPLSGTTQVSRYQKGKTSLNFTGFRE